MKNKRNTEYKSFNKNINLGNINNVTRFQNIRQFFKEKSNHLSPIKFKWTRLCEIKPSKKMWSSVGKKILKEKRAFRFNNFLTISSVTHTLTVRIQLMGTLSTSRRDRKYIALHISVDMKDITTTNRNQCVAPMYAGDAHAIHIMPRAWKIIKHFRYSHCAANLKREILTINKNNDKNSFS